MEEKLTKLTLGDNNGTKINESKLPLKKRSIDFDIWKPPTPPLEDINNLPSTSSSNSSFNGDTTMALINLPSSSSSALNKRVKILNPKPLAMINNNNTLVRSVDLPKPKKKKVKIHNQDCGNTSDNNNIIDNKILLASLADHIINNLKYDYVSDIKIVLEKKLTKTDIKDEQCRLAIPRNKILSSFLTHSEELFLKWKVANNTNTKMDVKVILGYSEYVLSLSRWNYHDKNNDNDDDNDNNEKKAVGYKYVLKNGWTKLKKENNLKEGNSIKIVTFRSGKYYDLHFAIIVDPTSDDDYLSLSL